MSLGPIANGVGAVLSRTVFLLTNTSTGIPIPLAILDVVKEEKPDYTAEVTEHPVEFGPETSDHVQLKNPILRLKGLISSTPLDTSVAIANVLAGGIAAFTSSQARSNLLNSGISQGTALAGAALQGRASNLISNGAAGALDAISRTILLSAYENRVPFDVITKRFRYKNMVIQRLSFPRNDETGGVLEFEIELKQITIVSPLKVQKNIVSEDKVSTASSSTDLGNQATQKVSTQLNNQVSKSSLFDAPGMNIKFPGGFA